MSGSLHRIRLVAAREFFVTVASKGFLFGVLAMPLLLTAAIVVLPKLMANRGVQVDVEVAVIDRSDSAFTARLGEELSTEAIAGRRDASRRQAAEQVGADVPARIAPAEALPALPRFTLKALPGGATEEEGKAWLQAASDDKLQRRALVVLEAASVKGREDGTYAGYSLFAPRNLPADAENLLKGAVRPALITERLRARGLDPQVITAATSLQNPDTRVVYSSGQERNAQGLNRLLPFIMGILLFMGIMIGGQGLMTSTVEEKSSRVVEVLLAAASSLELMWGKLLGQLGVGLVTMAVYVGLGLLALMQFAMLGLIDPMMVVWLFLFFLTAYLVFGALMMAIGAAVSQMADAQSLMGPVMILMMVPYIATPMVGNAPDSTFAVTASFIPPINGFIMMARLASTSPPPAWQVLLSLGVSVIGACIAVWFAAKVFRVGLLMHGKPPNFATLVKWARRS